MLRRPGRKKRELEVQRFFRRTNWADLWEDFSTKLKPNGMHWYKTIREFVVAQKIKDSETLRFLHYYLGPEDMADEAERARYPFAKPQDWKKRRDTGGWYSDEAITQLSRTISVKMNALEALAEAGNSVTLRAFVRISNLMRQLDNAFQGRFFVDDVDFATNIARSEAYLRLYHRVLNMLGTAQDLYAKSRGINFDDMEGLAHILAATAQMAKQVGDSSNKYEKALGALVQMTMHKASEYDLPIPQDAKDKLIEVTQEEDQPPPKKKFH